MSSRPARPLLALVVLCSVAQVAIAHKGPDPVAHWVFDGRSVEGDQVRALIGPNARLNGRSRVVSDEHGESLHLTGWGADCVIAEDHNQVADALPKQTITIEAWGNCREAAALGRDRRCAAG